MTRSRKATLPSRVAKIVWSRPTPAPGPALKRVPRWRTTIMPALTSWPSKILTPSRLDSESRPFFDEPRPFLCAIYSAFSFFLVVAFFVVVVFFAAGCDFPSLRGVDEGDLPLVPIAWISIWERRLRWPFLRLYPVRRRCLPTITFSPSTCAATFAVTCWFLSLSASLGSPSPPRRRSSGWNVLPSSCGTRSTSRRSPSRTRYCLPPTAMIAYVFFSAIALSERALLARFGGRFYRLAL